MVALAMSLLIAEAGVYILHLNNLAPTATFEIHFPQTKIEATDFWFNSIKKEMFIHFFSLLFSPLHFDF